jgi:hypothetical protein
VVAMIAKTTLIQRHAVNKTRTDITNNIRNSPDNLGATISLPVTDNLAMANPATSLVTVNLDTDSLVMVNPATDIPLATYRLVTDTPRSRTADNYF